MNRWDSVFLLPVTVLAATLVGGFADAAERTLVAWQVEWKNTVEAAKREGRVVVHTSGSFGPILTTEFQKTYPGITVVNVIGRGGAPALRILAEQRAGKYLADVVSAGIGIPYPPLYYGNALDPVRPILILPEVADEPKWWLGKHYYVDPERQYVFGFIAAVQRAGNYNKNLVDRKELKSYWDLLRSKWKGKIEVRDIRTPGPGGFAFLYHHPDLGPEYLRRLFGDMDVTIFADFRQGVDWLAQGKFAFCLGCANVDIGRAKKQGLPVETIPGLKEGAGITAQAGAIALLKNAAHPNAAKVFVNWVLSRDGQLTLQREMAKAGADAPESRRIDIPKDDILPESRRAEGLRYLDMDTPQHRDLAPVIKIFEEAVAKAGKK